jgi:putative glycosyltransferase (exosortase G-associated)
VATLSDVLFWGIWLLIPLAVDGLTALVALLSVATDPRRYRPARLPAVRRPMVSIIVPIYNSAETLPHLLQSLREQDYPHHRLEVLLMNNGSHDRSADAADAFWANAPFYIGWHNVRRKGKAGALNAGIHLARGEYVMNIDSDVVLAPDAIRQAVAGMEAQPDLGAATGAIAVLDRTGGSWWLRLLAICEQFEYIAAFRVARPQQMRVNAVYTLAGAFSIFRRRVLLKTNLYGTDTVSEDTDLTFDIYERQPGWRIGCLPDAIAYVHPIDSWSALYAQRLRWQRGQIEVSARHQQLLKRPAWQLLGLSPARILVVDHTLSLLRVAWTFLLPVLLLFGYAPSLLVTVLLVLYLFYLALDCLWVCAGFISLPAQDRRSLLGNAVALPALPIYRLIVYWYRVAGLVHAVAEPGVWRVEDPVTRLRSSVSEHWRQVTRRRAA